jgi:predicted molibdopterin-dependent oxidoreductase YjgC
MVNPSPQQPAPGRRGKLAGVQGGHEGEGRTSGWVEVDWDTALNVVAGKFTEFKQASGADSIALLASAKCTNEENYLVNKLARQVIGTNNIDHCARL